MSHGRSNRQRNKVTRAYPAVRNMRFTSFDVNDPMGLDDDMTIDPFSGYRLYRANPGFRSLFTTLNPIERDFLNRNRHLMHYRDRVITAFQQRPMRLFSPVKTLYHETKLNRDIICAKRRIRKEIIFALRLRAKGSGGGSRRITEQSHIKC